MSGSTARAATGAPRAVTQREQAAAEARTRILAAAADCIVRDGPRPGPDGLDRPHGGGVGRAAALPLRHQGAPLRRGADVLPRGLGRAQPARHGRRRRGPGRAAVVLPRPVPAQRRAARARVAALAGAGPALHPRPAPRQGRGRALRGPLRHRGRHRPRRAWPPGSSTPRSTRGRWPRRRSPSPTDSGRGSWRATPTSGSRRRAPRSPPPSASWSATTGRSRRPRPSRTGPTAMIPRHGLVLPRPSRRGFLTGGLALGASLTLPGCAYIRDDAPVDAPLPPSAKAEIDGDLVYFNWADYLAPRVRQGLPGGVRRQDHRVQLRLDGGHVRQDRGRQPVRHRLPDRQVGGQAPPRGQAPRHRPRPAARTPTRSSTPAPTSTTRGTTRGRRCRSRSRSTRPASAGAPTRCRR